LDIARELAVEIFDFISLISQHHRLTVHPNKKFVATGQIGKDPYIAVWDANTMETVALLKGFHQRGICALGFSNEGKYLVSVGLDDSHTIAIWDWQAGRVIASDKASQERVFDIEVSPYSNTIVTCGVKHIKVKSNYKRSNEIVLEILWKLFDLTQWNLWTIGKSSNDPVH
jgi:WD40 repeat protein